MSEDAIKLKRIRARFASLGDAKWLVSTDGDVAFLEVSTPKGELLEILRFHGCATPEEIDFFANAPEMVDFLLKLVDRAIARARNAAPREPQKQSKPKDFAAEAAMKCNDAAFKVFLEEKHGLDRPLTADRAAQKLRTLLGITSRSELNRDGAAADRWRSLRASFEAWRKVGQ